MRSQKNVVLAAISTGATDLDEYVTGDGQIDVYQSWPCDVGVYILVLTLKV